MIDHTGITVRNLQISKAFYVAVLGTLGYGITKEFPEAVGFGVPDPTGEADPGGDFWLIQATPAEPRPHFAFRATSAGQVNDFHQAALAAGARDNGPPGLRPKYHAKYYAAYVHDPDGYNIEAVFHGGV